jgi:hypothetical protein
VTTRRFSSSLSFAVRLQTAAVFGLTITAIAYVAVRLLDVVLFPEPNPVVVIWTDRSRFIWRVLIASYLGGAAVFAGYRLASRTPEDVFDWLERFIVLAGVCLLLQAIFAP